MTRHLDHLPDPAAAASPALRGQVLGLRGSMHAAARIIPLPARFSDETHGNQVTITDSETGLSVTIGLCDYRGARAALAALFPSPRHREEGTTGALPARHGGQSAGKLSERETAALAALATHGEPMTGGNLASKMTAAGWETSPAAAHQAGAALARKGLAIKGVPAGSEYVRYEITNAGRELAAQFDNDPGAGVTHP